MASFQPVDAMSSAATDDMLMEAVSCNEKTLRKLERFQQRWTALNVEAVQKYKFERKIAPMTLKFVNSFHERAYREFLRR